MPITFIPLVEIRSEEASPVGMEGCGPKLPDSGYPLCYEQVLFASRKASAMQQCYSAVISNKIIRIYGQGAAACDRKEGSVSL